MLLRDNNALIYGGGGVIGGAVARAFAREGAKVFLAGRTLAKLDRVAEECSSITSVARYSAMLVTEVFALSGSCEQTTTGIRPSSR